MKQVILPYMILFLGAFSNVQAQGLLDKLTGGSSDEPETRSLTEIVKGWEDGEYKLYRPYGSSTMLKYKGKEDLTFVKDDNGEVVKIIVGNNTEFEPYSYGGTDFMDSYFMNHMNVLFVSDEYIIRYHLETSEYTVKGIDAIYGKKIRYKKAMQIVQEYRDYSDEKIESDREAIKQAEIAHREKYTLEGRTVTKIEAVFPGKPGPPAAVTVGSFIDVGFELTLEDGTVMKTSNIGGHAYVEDLEIKSSSNCTITGVSMPYQPGAYGANPMMRAKLKVSKTSQKPGASDEATITVGSQYGGTGEFTMSFEIVYPSSVKYTCTGEGGYDGYASGDDGHRAGHGCPVTIEVKETKHTVSGESLYHIKITDEFTNDVSWYKLYNLGPGGGSTLEVNVTGGIGGAGAPGKSHQDDDYGKPGTGGNGGEGGDGGDIHVILDPSVKHLEIDYSNNGGSGGDGGLPGSCFSCPYGSDGDHGKRGPGGVAGTYKEEVGEVRF